jgi:Virulence factor membrane-bound polymerase, C-terminal
LTRLPVVLLLLLGWTLLIVVTRDYRAVQWLQQSDTFTGRNFTPQEKALLLDLHNRSLLAAYVDLGVARTMRMTPDDLKEKVSINTRLLQIWPGADVVYRQVVLLALQNKPVEACAMWRLAAAAYPSGAAITRNQIRQAALTLPTFVELSKCSAG